MAKLELTLKTEFVVPNDRPATLQELIAAVYALRLDRMAIDLSDLDKIPSKVVERVEEARAFIDRAIPTAKGEWTVLNTPTSTTVIDE